MDQAQGPKTEIPAARPGVTRHQMPPVAPFLQGAIEKTLSSVRHEHQDWISRNAERALGWADNRVKRPEQTPLGFQSTAGHESVPGLLDWAAYLYMHYR